MTSQTMPNTATTFDGNKFDHKQDGAILSGQMLAVFNLIRDGIPRPGPAIQATLFNQPGGNNHVTQ